MSDGVPLPSTLDRTAQVDAFVRTHWEKLCHVAYLSGVSADHVEDVVQNALARVLRTWARVPDGSGADVRTTAYAYVRYEIREYWRSRPRETPIADPEELPDIAAADHLTRRAQRTELDAFVESLSEIDRKIFTGRYLFGYTNRELAVMLKKTELSTEKVVERRAARIRLRALELGGDEE